MKSRNKLALVGFTLTMVGAYADPVRRWMLRWGATSDEVGADLPGDASIPHPRYVTDKAITIAAEPRHVFPWLTQLGWGRGGFYSYDRLENLMGLDLHSADELLPTDRHLRVGDILPNGPDAPTEGVWVETLEPDRVLVLRGTIVPGLPMRPGLQVPADAPVFWDWTWAFVLRPEGPSMTRLVSRLRADYRGASSTIIRYAALEPSQFVMERRMLLGIRDRAEHLAPRDASAGPPPSGGADAIGPEARPAGVAVASTIGIGLAARTEAQPAHETAQART